MHRLSAVLIALILTLTACQPVPAASGTAEATPKPSASAPAATPQPSASAPAATPATLASGCSDIQLPAADGLNSGSFADVVTTDLLTRTAPRIADDSKITGELNQPTRVYVVEGPVTASGYDWWQVIPEGGNLDYPVWVAAQGKDGEVWLRRAQDAQGAWLEVSRLHVKDFLTPTNRAIGVAGRMYFFGGELARPLLGQPSTRSLAFDLAGCVWMQTADLPHAEFGPPAVAAEGLVYVLRSGEAGAMLVYDPGSNAWTEASGPPRGLGSGSFFSVGGTADGQLLVFDSAGTFVYDIAADTWGERSTADQEIEVSAAAQIVDGAIAVLGEGAAGVWRFDLDDLAWRRLGSLRVALYAAGMAALPDGRLVIAGGYPLTTCGAPEFGWPEHPRAPVYGLVDVFDPVNGIWEALPPLPLELEGTAPIVIGGRLYIVGQDKGVGDQYPTEVVVARYVPPAQDSPAGQSPPALVLPSCGY